MPDRPPGAAWPAGTGEMARLIREFAWDKTPLGLSDKWPQSLRTAVDIILDMPGPATLWWGPQDVQIYNDAFIAILRERHPALLGKPAAVGWADLYDQLEPLLAEARTGKPMQPRDNVIQGASGPEAIIFDADWSVLRDESGEVAGILETLVDTTERHRAETALRASEERQAFLLNLSDTLRPLRDPVAIQEAAARALGERLGATRVAYVEVVGDEYVIGRDYVNGAPSMVGRHPVSGFGSGKVADYQAGKTRVICDTGQDVHNAPADNANFAAYHVRAGIGVPLVKDGEFVANLVVHMDVPRSWTPDEVALVEEAAERTWEAVERARAEAGLAESQERQAFLLRLSDALRPLDDPAEIQDAAIRILGEQLRANRVAYVHVTDDAYIIEQDYVDGVPSLAGRFPVNSPGTDKVADYLEGRTRVVRDTEREARNDPVGTANFAAFGVAAGIGVPLIKGGRLVATLIVHMSEPRDWTPGEVVLAEETAERTWAAVERARAETALRESERLRSAMLEVMPLGLGMIRTDGRVLLANAEWERFIPSGVIPSRDRERAWRWRAWDQDGKLIDPPNYPSARALRGEQVHPAMEFLYTHDDGRETWTSVGSVPIRDEAGEVVAAVSIIQDIDAEKRAAAALRDSEEQLRLIVESALDYAIFTTDREGVVQTWLPGAESVFGYSKAEAEGMSGDVLYTPEDLEAGVPQWEFETACREGSAADVRWHVRKDGRLVFIEGQVVPLRHGGTDVRGLLKIGRDATKRRAAEQALRESEERLLQFGEASSDILWMRDTGSTQWTYLTRAFEKIYGISRDEATAGDNLANWLAMVVPEDREQALEKIDRVAKGERVEFEYRIRRPSDGQIRWLRDTDFPIFDEHGRVARIGGIGQDVTALKQAEQHQRTLLAELQHRVRNTLAVVRSIARRTAENSVSVDDMLAHFQGRLDAFSRVQAALTRSADARVDLESLIEDEFVAHAAREGRQLSIDGPRVMLEPKTAERLSLAIHELTTNAVKHGALSGTRGRIEVRWKHIGDGKEELILTWEESGVELQDRALEREGFGMELLRRSLPYDLDATTEVELRPHGLRFELRMPLRPAPSAGN